MDVNKKFDKVRKPPSLPNWVLLNHKRTDETVRSIARFIVASPRIAFFLIYNLITDYVTLGVSRADIDTGISKIKNPLVQKIGREVTAALLPWLDEREIKGLKVFDDMKVMYPIGRGIFVPVKPTFTYNNHGKLTVVFVIAWADVKFDHFQKRLLLTIIHEAILTQEDFHDAEALVLFVPRFKCDKKTRRVVSLKIGDVPLLSQKELHAQFDRFGNALDEAVPMVLAELARRGKL